MPYPYGGFVRIMVLLVLIVLRITIVDRPFGGRDTGIAVSSDDRSII